MRTILITMATVLAFIWPGQAPLMAQEAAGGGACATPGSVIIEDVAASKAELSPSIARSITGYGRGAKAGNCMIKLVCVSADASDQAAQLSRQQCVAVRDLLVKSGFAKANIKTSRKKADSNWRAGLVYFTAY